MVRYYKLKNPVCQYFFLQQIILTKNKIKSIVTNRKSKGALDICPGRLFLRGKRAGDLPVTWKGKSGGEENVLYHGL